MSSNSKVDLDIAALLGRSESGGVPYRTFPPEDDVAPPVVETFDDGPPEQAGTAIETYARTVVEEREVERGAVMEAASQLLLSAISGNAPTRSDAGWDSIPVTQCLTMSGVTGGSGVTTVLANLAAALAGCGERVVIADRGPSLLPFYFGGRSFRTASSSFVPHRRSSRGPIHVVTGAADAEADDWLIQGLHEFQPDSDRVLLACRPGMSAEARQWAAKAPAVVLLLTPDPASLLRLPAVLGQMREAADNKAAQTLLLLNQFETANSLHAEIRATLSQQFGELLLPFVIRRDEAFSRCLAAGGSVAELMPDSRAAEDIRTLVEWLRNHGSTPEF